MTSQLETRIRASSRRPSRPDSKPVPCLTTLLTPASDRQSLAWCDQPLLVPDNRHLDLPSHQSYQSHSSCMLDAHLPTPQIPASHVHPPSSLQRNRFKFPTVPTTAMPRTTPSSRSKGERRERRASSAQLRVLCQTKIGLLHSDPDAASSRISWTECVLDQVSACSRRFPT